jgi:hypothetical protein
MNFDGVFTVVIKGLDLVKDSFQKRQLPPYSTLPSAQRSKIAEEFAEFPYTLIKEFSPARA